MARTLEDIYQEIADSIVESISDNWSKAIVTAEIEDDHGTLQCEYQKTSRSSFVSFDCEYKMYKAFKELRAVFQEEGKQPWSKAEFTLKSDGTFNLSFEY